MYTIPQITLLKGSHSDAGVTGRGCIMNVIAYLNNEPVITDESECVCFVVRPIAIWLNDYCNDEERQQLLPYVLRALGSKTKDRQEVNRRINLVVDFAKTQSKIAANAANAANAATYATYAAANAAAYAANAAANAAAYAANAAAYAATYATYAANAANAANDTYRKQIISAGIEFMNAALPPLEWPNESIINRIETLRSLNTV